MQSTNNPYNKSLLVAGIMTVTIGLILGIGIITINLNKYLTNLNKYTTNDKITLEEKMTSNDTEYDNYITEIESLKLNKQTLQKELSELPKTSNNSTKYLELEKQINTINSRLDELEKLKYSSLTEKNNLRKNYNEVLDCLSEKDSPKGLIKCYLVGFAIIIVSITTSAYLIHLAFQPDVDELILKRQLEIDNATKKSDAEVLKEATDKVLAKMSRESQKTLEKPKVEKLNASTKNSTSKTNHSKKVSTSNKTKTNYSGNPNNYKNKTTLKNNNYRKTNQNNKKTINSSETNNSKNTTSSQNI